MKAFTRLLVVLMALVWLFGCATQEEAPLADTDDADQMAPDTTSESPAETSDTEAAAGQIDPLAVDGIAGFMTGDGTALADGDRIALPTGGSISGRLIPTSTNSSVSLYVSRDGGIPSSDENWGGAISPDAPRQITGTIEGTAVYRVIAKLDGRVSEPFSVVVVWQHEDAPVIGAPQFLVDGKSVSGSITLSTSDGTVEKGRLRIECDYLAALLYITRDGSDPSPDNFWRSQVCDGTYLFSPDETAAVYRVVAIWQGTASEIAELTVEWATSE